MVERDRKCDTADDRGENRESAHKENRHTKYRHTNILADTAEGKRSSSETDTTNSHIREEKQIEHVWASGRRHVGVGRREKASTWAFT